MTDPLRRPLVARSRAHLADAGIGYIAHFGVAFGIGSQMIGAGAACIVHGLLPGLFTDKASSAVRRLHRQIERNHQAALRQPANLIEYEI